MRCPVCHEELSDYAVICDYCGCNLYYPEFDDTSWATEPQTSKRRQCKLAAILFGVSIICIALVSVVAYSAFRYFSALSDTVNNAEPFVLHILQSEWEQTENAQAALRFWSSCNTEEVNEIALRDDSGEQIATLYDDGDTQQNGDETAGDGIFSAILQIPLDSPSENTYYATYDSRHRTVESNQVDVVVHKEFPDAYYNSESATDRALERLLSTDEYLEKSDQERIDMVMDTLISMSENDHTTGKKYVIKDSIQYDEETDSIFFIEAAGTYCYIDFREYEEGTNSDTNSETVVAESNDRTFFSNCTETQNIEGNILFLCATSDDEATSLEGYTELSNAINQETNMQSSILVGSLENFRTQLSGNKIIVIECHGNIFELDGIKVPMLSSFGLAKNVSDSVELKADKKGHRVCKKLVDHGEGTHFYNLITPLFFEYYYGNTRPLEQTIVHVGSCYGIGSDIDDNNYYLSSSLLNSGASAVVGHTNSVYAEYDWWLLYKELHGLFDGMTISEALHYAEMKCGTNDVAYMNQFGSEEQKENAKHHTPAYNNVHGNVFYSLFGNQGTLGVLSGTVIDAETQKPLENVKVSTSQFQVTNDQWLDYEVFTYEDGTFYISALGDCTLTFTKEGYQELQISQYVEADGEIYLGDIALSPIGSSTSESAPTDTEPEVIDFDFIADKLNATQCYTQKWFIQYPDEIDRSDFFTQMNGPIEYTYYAITAPGINTIAAFERQNAKYYAADVDRFPELETKYIELDSKLYVRADPGLAEMYPSEITLYVSQMSSTKYELEMHEYIPELDSYIVKTVHMQYINSYWVFDELMWNGTGEPLPITVYEKSPTGSDEESPSTAPATPSETPDNPDEPNTSDPTIAEMAQLIQEAADYAWDWYWDPTEIDKSDVIYRERFGTDWPYYAVTAPGINSMKALRTQSHQYFSWDAISSMEIPDNWIEENGKLYVAQPNGLGDIGVEAAYITVRKEDSQTYTIELYEQLYSYDSAQYICTFHYFVEGGNWVFDYVPVFLGETVPISEW